MFDFHNKSNKKRNKIDQILITFDQEVVNVFKMASGFFSTTLDLEFDG